MNTFPEWISLISNLLTIGASGIAIYLFTFKRKSISSVISLLVNYTYQLSLSEVKEKLERLNDFNANDPEQKETVIIIMNELVGQIRGNEKFKVHFSDILATFENLISRKQNELTEPRKRAVVAELREKIRHLNVTNIDSMIGERNE